MSIPSHTKPILMAAATPQQLVLDCQEHLRQLQSHAAAAFQTLLEESDRPIPKEFARMGFVCESPEEAAMLLQTGLTTLEKKIEENSWSLRKGVHFRRHSFMEGPGKIVALFSGQGSQYLGMGHDLQKIPAVAETFHAMDTLFENEGLTPLSAIIFPEPAVDDAIKKEQEHRLTLTEHAQPAIGVVSVALYKILHDAGLRVDATAGHSFGEVTALWAAGVFSDEDYFFLAKARGKAMAAPDDPHFDAGGMLAVKADSALVEKEAQALPEITVANLNSGKQVVLAGPKPAVLQAQGTLKEKGYSVVLLPVSAAFHTKLVGHAQKPFADAIHAVAIQKPQIPVYSNTTGDLYPSEPAAIRAILDEHILNPVFFKTEIENTYKDGGRIFIEFGPKNVLANLVSSILEGKPHSAISLNANPKKASWPQLQDGVVQLRVLGLEVKL